MRWRPLTWFLLSGLCFVSAFYFWKLGDQMAAGKKPAAPKAPQTRNESAAHRAQLAQNFQLLSQPGKTGAPALPTARASNSSLRLRNTGKSLQQLTRDDHAILLENALFDTAQGVKTEIPDHLKSQGDPGSYIVQSRAPLDRSGSFAAQLKAAGATIVSYIPNNAFLVRASESVALQLQSQAQAVLPYEPYYKLRAPLLATAVNQAPMADGTLLTLLLFPNTREQALADLQGMGVQILGEDRSPFGPVLHVQPSSPGSLPALAGLTSVQEIELAQARIPANDLSRSTIGVASDSQVSSNYLGLTGTNILVAVVDTGVDTNHPDLQGRVYGDSMASFIDTIGHGTFEAGIIAGSGFESLTVSNAPGSPPGAPPYGTNQFRGVAPQANILSIAHDNRLLRESSETTLMGGFNNFRFGLAGSVPDYYMQETAARTNYLLLKKTGPMISNNGWNYTGFGYDVAAASYDAAVRDAIPEEPGSQPMIYVFPAGNSGGGSDTGQDGVSDSVRSPGTAKNVITVGAVEQNRQITNIVTKITPNTGTNGTSSTNTSQPWLGETDSSDQIAAFSGRGNVGVDVEGPYGRFKPDVVAPGTFFISTRSGIWNETNYYNPTSSIPDVLTNIVLRTNGAYYSDSIFVPANAVAVTIEVYPNSHSPDPFPNLPIYVTNAPPGTGFFTTTNDVYNAPGDGPLSPVNTFWNYRILNNTTGSVNFNIFTSITVTNEDGDLLTVLSNLNNSIGGGTGSNYYRFESGTSMAAADVSGMLALMQQFFQQYPATPLTPSPALMKAMLINGARSLNDSYNFEANPNINLQGWGLVNLTNTLPTVLSNLTSLVTPPTTNTSMILLDQNPSNTLATGQSRTYYVTLSPDAQYYDFRVTLVWTDPPGNPAAGVKLVNDLDLIVTNMDQSNVVYYGNNISSGVSNDPSDVSDTNSVPILDSINNVENVFISSSSVIQPSRYAITVSGHRVNVNAVTAQTNDIVQDYALVISSGNGEIPDGLSMSNLVTVTVSNTPFVTVITNMFASLGDTNEDGGLLLNQRVGASSPLIGTNQVPLGAANGVITLGETNQWHFYLLTNLNGYTNAAFLTFSPNALSDPRMGVTNDDWPEMVTRQEADIDLYVSTEPGLTNLDPAVVSRAAKSLSSFGQLPSAPRGEETVILSNAVAGIYYVGVKSEDQLGGEYGILGAFSQTPFGSSDSNGNSARGIPVPYPIPDGSPSHPSGVQILAVPYGPPILIRRVIVTNAIAHELQGDLLGTLNHSGATAVLNNHSTNMSTFVTYTYDDSGQGDIPGARPVDGPGTLHDFAGRRSGGQWMLTEIDNAAGHVGTNVAFGLFLEKQPDLTQGINLCVLPGACDEEFVEVPTDATNLTVIMVITNGLGPMTMSLCPLDGSGSDCKTTIITNGTGVLSIDIFDNPPLLPGVYSVKLCNPSSSTLCGFLIAKIFRNPGSVSASVPSTSNATNILDDATTYSSIKITNHMRIEDLSVGMLITDPRASDLAITLIAPDGQRVLLYQDRGNSSANGLGTFSTTTNSSGEPVLATYTNYVPFWTNDFESAAVGPYAPGTLFQDWTVLGTNLVRVYPDYSLAWFTNNMLLLQNGVVSNTLPTTNSEQYLLTFRTTHAPYLVGTVGWWPFDGTGEDIFGGLNGQFYGNAAFSTGKVAQAFYPDGSGAYMMVPRSPELDVAKTDGFSIEGWIKPDQETTAFNPSRLRPLVYWANVTNGIPGDPVTGTNYGIQLALIGQGPGLVGSLVGNIYDTNSGVHTVITTRGSITNGGWQHVAFTYDAASLTATIYTNGKAAASTRFSGPFTPRTFGDVYFGADPVNTAPDFRYGGGMDEFGIYNRALTPCEVQAIYNAGSNGKYGTNVLVCPVGLQVTLGTGATLTNAIITNGFNVTYGTNTWLAGPTWETNYLYFSNPLLSVTTNGPGTNLAPVLIQAFDPNVAIDDVVLSALKTNNLSGLMHFTDDTNLAQIPIKYAPTPYSLSNVPPTLIYSNNFDYALKPGNYKTGATIRGNDGTTNGPRDWSVISGPVTVVTNDPLIAHLTTNYLVLSQGQIESTLPTVPGHRYQLTYSVRGPAAVGWWNGHVNPLDRRAQDVIAGNDGAFYLGATNTFNPAAFRGILLDLTNLNGNGSSRVGADGLYFDGMITNYNNGTPALASKVEIGNPPSLDLTNSLTIEGWIKPVAPTNYGGVEQLLFRGDSRDNLDPYWLGLTWIDPSHWDLRFHIESANSPTNGFTVESYNTPVVYFDPGQWHHVAAVFERDVHWSDDPTTWHTNQLRLYIDGAAVTNLVVAGTTTPTIDGYTAEQPLGSLDPAFSPGVTLGNRSRQDFSQPYRGYMDEMTVYGRALTAEEIAEIAAAGSAGKADITVPPVSSLAEVAVFINNSQLDTGHGNNSQWTTRSVIFNAIQTNSLLDIEGLLPGTLVDDVSLVELPAELNYFPEDPLSVLNGMDAYGTWQLEITDSRTGITTNAILQNWQLNFTLLPSNPPPVITLEHGIPYFGTLAANSSQNFIVEVPQWATMVTNALLNPFARNFGFNLPVTVLLGTNNFPDGNTNMFMNMVSLSSTNILTTNITTSVTGDVLPPLEPGYPYFLTVTNPNPTAMVFGMEIWYDLTTLTNCIAQTNFAYPAGVPRYFQYDVPTNGTPADLLSQLVNVTLNGANSNLTMVLSEHLPLPDLNHNDYMSALPGTNQEVIMLVTNSTPYPIQTNRWYIGVYNTTATNVPFNIQACSTVDTNYPILIRLTNTVEYTVTTNNANSAFLAPPGPPKWFFFEFQVTNSSPFPVNALLFQLYNLSSNADLVLQRDVPPTLAPYFAWSREPGTNDEQIVVRSSGAMNDLQGNWFLGVYNNTQTNVSYTIRAAWNENFGLGNLLTNGLPFVVTPTNFFSGVTAGPYISWDSVIGENYIVHSTNDVLAPTPWPDYAWVNASTPLASFLVPGGIGAAFFRIEHVTTPYPLPPTPTATLVNNNADVQVTWPSAYSTNTYMLQYSLGPSDVWYKDPSGISQTNNLYITVEPTNNPARLFRLFPY